MLVSNDNLLKPIQSNAVDKRTDQVTASVRTPILMPTVLAQAILAIQRMSQHEKLQLGDELYLHQPNPEPYLLAFVHEELHKQGWERITNGTVKHLVLVALNLVECVATSALGVNQESRAR